MIFLSNKKENKKGNKKGKRHYNPGVIDLVKLIRNMGEHYHEKNDE